jgi:Domain of unknown function (DUF1905)/Bacteriocin-protection, YdeI or OmpD-Associated
MSAPVTFRATVGSASDTGTMTFVEVPPKVMAALGPRKRVPVRVTINGYTFRSTNSVYGGVAYIGLRAEVRKAAGIDAGDRISVTLEYDPDSRAVEPPPDLAKALRAARLADAFTHMSPSHQKEYVMWLEDAKRPETRERRRIKIVDTIREKIAAH